MKKLTRILINENSGQLISAAIAGAGLALVIMSLVLSIVLSHYQLIPK
jgi:hypothetical protein